jgi:hypothetical protein
MSSAIATATLLPSPAPRRHEEERQLNEAVTDYLAVALPLGAVVHHSPGEGLRSKAAQGRLVRSGFCKGWPDLEIVWRSRVYFIELKAARGVLSKAQRECHRRLLYADAPVACCKSVPEVEAALREMCVPLRATVAA